MAVRWLNKLADLVVRYPGRFIYPQFLLFALCVFYTAGNLGFDTSRNNLVGSDKRYHQRFLAFLEEFPAEDDLVVVVESPVSEEKMRAMFADIDARLSKFPEVGEYDQKI